MPVIFELTFEDDSTETIRLPAEIWNKNNENVTKMVVTEKPVKSILLDPRLELADVEMENNYFPRRISKSRFQLFKDRRRGGGSNPMREAGLGATTETSEEAETQKAEKKETKKKGAKKKPKKAPKKKAKKDDKKEDK